jgi:plasmid stabilization system protein ParE
MASTLIIKAEAERDLAEAIEYYDRQRPGLGDEFLNRIRDAFALLKENPLLAAKSYNEIRQTKVPQFPFVVSYFVEGGRIIVLAILHGRRDPRTWQSRGED